MTSCVKIWKKNLVPSVDTSGNHSSVPSYVPSINPSRAPSEQPEGDLQEERRITLEQVKSLEILLH